MPGSTRASAIREGPAMTVTLPSSAAAAAAPQDTLAPKRTVWQHSLAFVRRQPLGTFGLVIVVVMFLAGVFAPWIAPFDPEENDFNAMMQAPNLIHWLGTDQLGRDIFSRLVYGARTALIVGFS